MLFVRVFIVAKEYYENGKIKVEGTYKNGKLKIKRVERGRVGNYK